MPTLTQPNEVPMTNPAASSTAVAIRPTATGFGLVMSPQTIEQTREFCLMLSKTEFVPKAFRGKPDSIMVVGAMGARLGLDVFAAMAGIADINGKPCIWGDAMLAVVLNCTEFEDIEEVFEGKAYDDTFRAICTVKRKGKQPTTRSFSVIEAKEAGLWKKPGPWSNTPQRMLQMRARAFACRDRFADALAGFQLREEAEDMKDVTDSATVHGEPRPAKARTIEATAAPAAVESEPNAGLATTATVEAPAAGAELDKLEKAEREDLAKPKDLSVEKCVADFSALWKHSDAGKARAKAIQQTWNLEKIADLAGAADGDREAFLAEVAEGMALVKG